MDENILATGGEDWDIVARLLPAGWEDKARELGALRRFREFRDAATLLRVLFIHLAEMAARCARPLCGQRKEAWSRFRMWPFSSGCEQAANGCAGWVKR